MTGVDDISVNDVVQIDPEKDERWGSCFLIVSEVKSWGVEGYLRIPMQEGNAFYRVPFENTALIGKAEWALPE